MAKVNILDEHTSNLIAAGEVVIDPKSVIKELVENSLDANAKNITIILDEAGYKQIVIDDDGDGMSYVDAQNSIKRHATSKIKNQFDLNSITTLGFRGEALPSIASVSSFTLETTDKNSSAFIQINGGKIINSNEFCDRNQGTKITIKNLFYNTPARLKHQVTPKYQFSQIKEYIYQMSLIKPNIKFNLIHNDILVLSSFENDLIANVSQIYGLEVAKNINMIEKENMDFKINGFYVDPKYSKANKKAMLFSINKRLIWSNNLATAVVEALSSYLMVKKYPICYIDIEIDTSLIDVNVHPQKRLVKISKEEQLVNLIIETINENMQNNLKLFTLDETSNETNNENNIVIQDSYPSYKKSSISQITQELNTNSNVEFNPNFKTDEPTQRFEDALSIYNNVEEKKPNFEHKDLTRNNMPKLFYIGQYLDSYLLTQCEDTLVLIDQHAAMERINYEKNLQILSQNEKYFVELAVPISLNVSLSEMEMLIEKQDLLKGVAIVFEQFGDNTILIRNVPSFINTHKVQKFLQLVFECVFNNENLTLESLINEMAIIKACKLSIKANQQLDNYEANKLIQQLYYVKNYTSCPHGRPISVKLTTNQIEKWFKRIV